MFGFLNVHKLAGLTSRDVVDRVQRIGQIRGCGHAGTLDPLATGVLVVGVGKAVRLIEYVQQLAKTYRGQFLLGRASDTEDIEGQIRLLDDPPRPSRAEIERQLVPLIGTIPQVPPQFSALKVGGRRAHEIARLGLDVPLVPRPVMIHSIDLLDYEYPRLELRVRCGSGTYMRSLGRDLARACGTEAVMSILLREAVGDFTIDTAVTLAQLAEEGLQRHLQSAHFAVPKLARVRLTPQQCDLVIQGRAIHLDPHEVDLGELLLAEPLAAFDPADRLRAILVRCGPDQWRAKKNL